MKGDSVPDTTSEEASNNTRKRTNESLLSGDGYAVDTDCTREEFLAVAKVYARAVADRFDLTVTVSDLSWEVSTRAKRRAGVVEYRDGEPERVKLAWRQFQGEGWEATASTIRHELIHAHLLNEGVGAGHGDRFRALADRLDTPVHCDRFTTPKWWVECVDCETRLGRYRESKLVANPEQYRCGECGGKLQVEPTD